MNKVLRRLMVFLVGFWVCLLLLELSLRIVGSHYAGLSEKDYGLDVASLKSHQVILAIGDSVTFGIGAPRDLSYPMQLQKMLNRSHPRPGFTVINRGRPGQNSSQLLPRLEGQLRKYKPDIVTILIGAQNQSNYYGYQDYLKKSGNHKPGFLLDLYDALDRIRVYKFFRLLLRDTTHMSRLGGGNGATATEIATEEKQNNKRGAPEGEIEDIEKMSTGKLASLQNPDLHLYENEKPDGKREPLYYPNKPYHEHTPECIEATEFKLKGESGKALEIILNVVGKKVIETECYNIAATIYRESKQYDKAVEWYKKGIERDPGEFRNYEGIGWTFHQQDRMTEAHAWFLKGFEHARYETLYAQCYDGITETFRILRDFNGGVKFYEKEIKREPLVDDFIHRLAGDYLYMFKNKRHRKAVNSWIRSDVEQIIDLCEKYNAKVILQNYPAQPTIEPIYREIARYRNVPYVDHQSTFTPYIDKDENRDPNFFVPDGHPNEKGYRLMAQNILKVLQKKKE